MAKDSALPRLVEAIETATTLTKGTVLIKVLPKDDEGEGRVEHSSGALAAAGVISAEEAAAGFVTVVNGEEADYNADGAWWCLTDAAGEMTTVGVADIELHDGDSYAFTYTK